MININKFIAFFNKRKYVITSVDGGLKYYYKGSGSTWTTSVDVAKKYKKKPDFKWISNLWHNIEEYKK